MMTRSSSSVRASKETALPFFKNREVALAIQDLNRSVAPRQSMQNTSEGRAAEAKKLTRQGEREANKVLMNKATAHSEPLGRIETLELEITFTVAHVAKLKAAIASLEAECKKLEVSVEKEPKAFKRVSQKLAHTIEQAKCRDGAAPK